MKEENSHLVEIVEKDASIAKVATVDTGASISYSLVTGAALDYWSGLSLSGIIASRSYGTAMNFFTSSPYGFWREKIHKLTRTKEESGKLRKGAADLLAFNTFQTPLYATAIAAGCLISEGRIDWEKVKSGVLHLAEISPFIGPTFGMYNDWVRKLFGVKSASEGAYKKR